MQAEDSPFTPGAGVMPEVMAGRDAIVTAMIAQTRRAFKGRAARSLVLHGLRRVVDRGRTRQALPAAARGAVRKILISLDTVEKARRLVRAAGGALASLVRSVNVQFPGGSVGVEFEPKPVVLIGAGLPNVLRQLGESRSYSERLFIAESVGPLSREATDAVLADTLALEDVKVETAALDALWAETEGYPHFIQEWAMAAGPWRKPMACRHRASSIRRVST